MKRLLTCVALLALMVGCKEPLPEEPVVPDGKLPINLSLSTTRANDSAYEEGDQIGLYVANYADGAATQLVNSGNHVNNMQFTLTDNSWTPATKIYWKDKSTRADFYAYYPYQSTVADVAALPVSVQADQSSEENYWASDLLWGKTSGVAPTESAVNIATTHALSNLLIYVEPGYGFTAESLAAADVSVEINNVKTAGALNLTNGVVTASGEAATITPWNTGEYYRALIVPQTVADDTTLITVTIDGKAHTIERGFTFVANTQHTFVVRIENDIETKVTLSINPWNEDHNTYGMPDNEIWYTSTVGEIVVPNASASFGANLLSNTYVNGKGVMTFDGPVTEIGDYAFYFSGHLESIIIPNSCTSVGESPFQGSNLLEFQGKFASADGRCVIVDGEIKAFAPAGLTEYTIPDGVTSIGMGAFFYADIENITIPEGVTSIGKMAFCGSHINSITIPESVTIIGESAFTDCWSLKNLDIPNAVTEIGFCAFNNCDSLTHITIPESVTKIGNAAFVGCNNLIEFTGKFASDDGRCLINDGLLIAFAPAGLKEYSIPQGVTEIGESAFFAATLVDISIPEGVTVIGEKSFSNSTIEQITIPESVTYIDLGAFSSCRSLSRVYCKSLTPPTLTQGNGSWLYPKVFEHNAMGRIFYVPTSDDNSVANTYKQAEVWNEYADDIIGYDFTTGIVDMPDNEIWYTSTDGEIVVPNQYATFGANLLSNTYVNGRGVMEFDGPVTEIGMYSFNVCTNLESITLPKSVITIGYIPFNTLQNLLKFEGKYASADGRCLIVDGEIKDFAPAGLTEYTIPEGVTSIAEGVFSGSALTTITIPESVVSIGNYVFMGCHNLKEFRGKYASADGRFLIVDGKTISFAPAGLTKYAVPEGVTAIGEGTFDHCGSLTTITIPEGVTDIGRMTFRGCSNLASIVIPDGVISIGDNAFRMCSSLASITIPESVVSIEESAFFYCSNLSSVYITNYDAWSAIEFGDYQANPLCYGAKLYLNGEDITNTLPNIYKMRGAWQTKGGTYKLSSSGITSVASEQTPFNLLVDNGSLIAEDLWGEGVVIGYDEENKRLSLKTDALYWYDSSSSRVIYQMWGTYDEEQVFVPYLGEVYGYWDETYENVEWVVPDDVTEQLYFAIVVFEADDEYGPIPGTYLGPYTYFWKIEDFGFTRTPNTNAANVSISNASGLTYNSGRFSVSKSDLISVR